METVSPPHSDEERRATFRLLLESELFDKFLATRFGNVKRYGAEVRVTLLSFDA